MLIRRRQSRSQIIALAARAFRAHVRGQVKVPAMASLREPELGETPLSLEEIRFGIEAELIAPVPREWMQALATDLAEADQWN